MAFRFDGINHAGQEWRAAGAIVTFGQQIEAIRPGKFRTDGTVASKTHDQNSPKSDHRPNPRSGLGTVRAIDFAEGTRGFVDEVAEALRLSQDRRINYVIHDRRKFSSFATSKFDAWEWRPYTGENGHKTHGHLSVVSGKLSEQTQEFAVVPGQTVREVQGFEIGKEEMAFTAGGGGVPQGVLQSGGQGHGVQREVREVGHNRHQEGHHHQGRLEAGVQGSAQR